MILEQIKQQVGLSAATDARYHLDKSIVFFAGKLVQIDVSLNFHIIILLSTESFCELSQNSSIELYPIQIDYTTSSESFCELSQFHTVEFAEFTFMVEIVKNVTQMANCVKTGQVDAVKRSRNWRLLLLWYFNKKYGQLLSMYITTSRSIITIACQVLTNLIFHKILCHYEQIFYC